MGDWGGRSRTCFWSGSWGSWSLWSNSSHTMVTAAGATRLLYRHQKSMHCIYTQILWLFNALLTPLARLSASASPWLSLKPPASYLECKPRRCFQPIKILQFYWCYFVIGRGILQPLLEFSTQSPPQIAFNQYTNRKNESRCLYLHSDWVGKTDVWVGLAHPCPCLEPALPIYIKQWGRCLNRHRNISVSWIDQPIDLNVCVRDLHKCIHM